MGPGGDPDKWKYVRPEWHHSNTDNIVKDSQNPALSEKLNMYSKKLENNDSSQENDVSMIHSNNTER